MFPTIPTVASGDLLSSTTSPASQTHTFPNLSSLRGGAGPQAGDLLIAICVQYEAATAGNQYSSWGASFVEMLDDALSSGTGVGAIGIATKTATGSESGTFTVTSVNSFKSVQFLMRIPAGTWQATEIQAATRATGVAADPGAFNPAGWDVADTLWISVAGQTETSTQGSPPAISTPPSNYSGASIVARVADAVGDITAAVAFRQLNANSDDVGLWTGVNLNRGNGIATVIAVRPAPATLYGASAMAITLNRVVFATKKTFGQTATPLTFGKAVSGIGSKKTAVAEISLASHDTPPERTNHSIKIRARTTSGSTGVIKAALYENTTNRSGDLISSVLTNSLADYTLAIPDASAANITDYSDLSIRFWGYDAQGNALVFEVADIYLELPAVAVPETFYGVVTRPFTFGKSVLATKQTFGQAVAVFTFVKGVSGVRIAFGQIVAPFTFIKETTARRTTFGQVVVPITFAKVISGAKETFSQIEIPFIFNKNITGQRTTFSQISLSLINSISTAGERVGNILYGVVTFPITLSKEITGYRTTFGQILAPFTFSKAITGVKTTFGQIISPFIFAKSVIAQRTTFGQLTVPIIFSKIVDGARKTFGQIVTPFTFSKEITASKTTFGQTTIPITFNKEISGRRTTFSQFVTSFIFGKDVAGHKTTFAQIDLPVIFMKEIVAQKETFGLIEFPIDINFSVVAEVQGIRFGATSMSLIFGKEILATKETFGQIASPYIFVPSTEAKRTTFGAFDRPFLFTTDSMPLPLGDTNDNNIFGQRETFGQLTFPINASFIVGGSSFQTHYGQLDMGLVFGEQTIGQRQTFGQSSTPYLFAAASEAIKTTFSKIESPIDFIIDVETGKVEAFSQLAFEIFLGLETAGFMRPEIIILNLAKAIYLGSTSVDAVYTDSQKVWPK